MTLQDIEEALGGVSHGLSVRSGYYDEEKNEAVILVEKQTSSRRHVTALYRPFDREWYLGHYFQDEDMAKTDFSKRSASLSKSQIQIKAE